MAFTNKTTFVLVLKYFIQGDSVINYLDRG